MIIIFEPKYLENKPSALSITSNNVKSLITVFPLISAPSSYVRRLLEGGAN